MRPDLPSPGARAVLWDLDGTLVDTALVHWQAWRAALPAAAAASQLSWEAFLPTFGLRNDALIPKWLGTHPSAGEIRRISEVKEERYRALLGKGSIRLVPGAENWLRRLRGLGWRQAIATMTPRQNLELILLALDIGQYLDAVVTAEDVVRGKPEPDVFLAAAGRLSVPPARCLVIEDSPAGVEAARRAGMRVIGVGPAVQDKLADYTVVRLTDLSEYCFALIA
jgi:HAD superfamily hydrolase (TIGR01509 family)